ncbi:YjbE family putative metal transport protein [Acidisoma cellulosilytica]|uniref:YjbE family putative metal transport protein n=1 Tax=Acidisoma cellulosilyticum TaxID=2802395 RepID=A0A964E2G2_9PROT|nr:YjbE family putative metal transport protein [Acidisoma cellulosilyticum]MCB8879585.1 YjbE family putative metal transport protein [Acidisoma cellulosilyticum]
MNETILLSQIAALAQVLMIDLVLAGDNAVVIGLAVAGLAPAQKRKAVLAGIGFAVVIRIAMAMVALKLLAIVGLTLAGGILLLWVCWKMFRELRHRANHADGGAPAIAKTPLQAAIQIAIADISMSLDNVLAVAGAAHEHPWILALGLLLSVVLMGIAASVIATQLEKRRWIAWVGLAVVLFVAVKMIWEGTHKVIEHFGYMPMPGIAG